MIVDTGSTDRTIEIAREFGATVIEREWTGSFADARNVSFDAATGDWLMFLDADEVLVDEDVERLRALRGQTWREAFYLTEISYTGELGDGTAATHTALRVFRARPEYRFRVACTSRSPRRCRAPAGADRRRPTSASSTTATSARCATRRRSRAATSSCCEQRDEAVASPFLHFNLGSEYGAVGDARRRWREFERAWELIARRPERPHLGLHARARRAASCARCASAAAARTLAARRRGAARCSPASPTSSSSRRSARWRSATDAAIAGYERCIAMGDAPRTLHRDRRDGHLPADDRDSPRSTARAGDRAPRWRCCDAASPSTRASSAPCCRSRPLLRQGRRRRARSSRGSRRASPS